MFVFYFGNHAVQFTQSRSFQMSLILRNLHFIKLYTKVEVLFKSGRPRDNITYVCIIQIMTILRSYCNVYYTLGPPKLLFQ